MNDNLNLKILNATYKIEQAQENGNIVSVAEKLNDVTEIKLSTLDGSEELISVDKDFINIDVTELEEYASAQAKLKRENAKQLIVKDETGKDRVVRVKDEIPYYQVGNLSSFTNIKSVENIFKSYNAYTLTVDSDNESIRKKIKNMLYIPLDNKNKSIAYINNYINNVVSKSLFIDKSVADNTVLHSQLTIFQALDYVSYIKYYKGPKENLRSNSRKYKSPFSGKIIVCMNEAKAKKIGMRSFKEYFERTFLNSS